MDYLTALKLHYVEKGSRPRGRYRLLNPACICNYIMIIVIKRKQARWTRRLSVEGLYMRRVSWQVQRLSWVDQLWLYSDYSALSSLPGAMHNWHRALCSTSDEAEWGGEFDPAYQPQQVWLGWWDVERPTNHNRSFFYDAYTYVEIHTRPTSHNRSCTFLGLRWWWCVHIFERHIMENINPGGFDCRLHVYRRLWLQQGWLEILIDS